MESYGGIRTGIAALLWAVMAVQSAAKAEGASFDFIVIGCMPYHFPADDARFRNLIEAVNARQPAFTVHLGDIKSGKAPCSDEAFARVSEYFRLIAHPLVYSVGDNEWTDCGRPECGGFDPLERLERLRALFFDGAQSLGASPMPLHSQRDDPRHARHVENSRWERGGVTFVALHVVGSGNNAESGNEAAKSEFRERDEANEAWLRAGFAEARAGGSRAVALFIQANPFDDKGNARGPGFERFVRVLREETLGLGGPVVLFHADSHYFRIDKPLRTTPGGALIEQFTRVETFGAENMHAVRVTVEPGHADVFTVRPMLIDANRRTAGAPVP